MISFLWISLGEAVIIFLLSKLAIKEIKKDREFEARISSLLLDLELRDKELWRMQTRENIQADVKGELFQGYEARGMLTGIRKMGPALNRMVDEIIEPRLLLESAKVKAGQYDQEVGDLRNKNNTLREAHDYQIKQNQRLNEKNRELHDVIKRLSLENDKLKLEKAVREPYERRTEAGPKPFQVVRNPSLKPYTRPNYGPDTAFDTTIEEESLEYQQKWKEYAYEAGNSYKFRPMMDGEIFTGEVDIVSKKSGKSIHRFHVKDLRPGKQIYAGMAGHIVLCGLNKYGSCDKITFASQRTKVACCRTHAQELASCEKEGVLLASNK